MKTGVDLTPGFAGLGWSEDRNKNAN